MAAAGAYFGQDVRGIIDRLLVEQLPDGGWNCEAANGSMRSSFNTTICVLEALLEHELRVGSSPQVSAARLRGQEYLLERRLFRRRSTGAVIDYLETRDDVDASRIGVMGISLGGYYAPRSAAFEPRIKAAVSLAGPYQWSQDWDLLPPQTRATFCHRSGAKTEAEAREKLSELTLADAASRITIPLLVAAGGRDRLVPTHHAERLASEAPGAELYLLPDGSHGLTNHAVESRSKMADWLAAHL